MFTLIATQIATFELGFSFSDGEDLWVYILFVWRYILLIFVGWDMWKVTRDEPTDPLLTGKVSEDRIDPDKMFHCILCEHLVMK